MLVLTRVESTFAFFRYHALMQLAAGLRRCGNASMSSLAIATQPLQTQCKVSPAMASQHFGLATFVHDGTQLALGNTGKCRKATYFTRADDANAPRKLVPLGGLPRQRHARRVG